MTIISKGAAGLSLVSCIRDINASAVIYAKNSRAKVETDTFISRSNIMSKTNYLSKKDTDRKNWLLKNDITAGIKSTLGTINGYIKGFASASVRYIPNFIVASVAMLSKNKIVANTGAAILGVIEGVDFAKNSLGWFQKKNGTELK